MTRRCAALAWAAGSAAEAARLVAEARLRPEAAVVLMQWVVGAQPRWQVAEPHLDSAGPPQPCACLNPGPLNC